MNAWLVRGDDPALVGDEVRRLVTELSGGDPLAVEELAADAGAAAVVDACSTPPFLGRRRVVVAREVGRFGAEEVAPLLSWLADPLPTTALVLTGGGGQVGTRLVNAVRRVGSVVDAGAGTGRARAQWLASRLKAGPVRLDARAADALGRHLGEDVARLGSLLEALAAAYGPGARVGPEELEPFLGRAGAVAPWDLTDAVDRGDVAGALAQLRRLLDGGERHPLVVTATLHRHYAAMLRLDGAGVADEASAAALLGMAPYPARKALTQARRLGGVRVARAVELLAAADVDLRGATAVPPEAVLEILVARLARLGRR